MGDPKRIRSKYDTPVHPWQKERLEEEKSLVQIYGLVNKKEVYKAGSRLKKFKDIAKSLVSKSESQAEKEREQLFRKLKSLNLVQEELLDAVLGLELEQLMERRLQTIVFKKGLARSVKQARQMITHRHITVNGKMITSPSYLVTVSEEANIGFYVGSSFDDEEHPERKPKEVVKDKVEVKDKTAKKTEKKAEPKKEEPKAEKKEEVLEKPAVKEEPKEEPKAEEKKEEKKEEPKPKVEAKVEEPKVEETTKKEEVDKK